MRFRGIGGGWAAPTSVMKNTFKIFLVLLVGAFSPLLATAGEEHPALGGYCPVAYFKADHPLMGSAEFASVYEGKTYYLVNEGAKEMFEKNPSKYLPEYDGYCAYGMTKGKKFPVDPTVYAIVDGKLYLNKNAEVGEIFGKDTKNYIKTADKKWAELM